MFSFGYFGKIQDEKKFEAYIQNKVSKKPLKIGFGAKLTSAILDCILSLLNSNLNYNEKSNELYRLIASKYKNLRDIFNDSGYDALKFFFGEQAPVIKEIWITSFDYGYQEEMTRRPFRTKYRISTHYHSKTDMLYRLIYLTALEFDLNKFLKDPYVYQQEPFRSYSVERTISLLITYEIDHGNQQVRDQVEKIVYENTGNLCTEVLLALVQSKDTWSHKLLGNLLLAAKLQEGLRQSIVELMDGGSPQAFKYLLKLIIDNKFERFSSVVRAFDVWTGLPVSAQSPSTIRYYLNVIQDCVTNGHYDTYLSSVNPLENYLALLCKGFYEVQDGLEIIENFIGSNSTARRMIGYYWLSQSGDYYYKMPYFEQHVDERQPEVIAFMLPCLMIVKDDNVKYLKSLSEFFYQLKAMVDQTPSDERRVSLPGMNEVTAVYSHGTLYYHMITIASLTKSTELFDILCDYMEVMGADTRFTFMGRLVMNITTEKQRRVVLMSACDKSDSVRKIAFNALKNIKLAENEFLELEKMLRFKAESLRKNVIVLLLEQNPKACVETVRRLAASEDANCRLAARQLAQDMKNKPAFKDVINDALSIAGLENTEITEPDNDSEENGFGLFNPERLRKLELPACPDIKLSDVIPDYDIMVEKLNKLSALVDEHRDYTYETIHCDDSRSQVVFGTQWIHPDRREPETILLHDVFIPEVNKLFPGLELVKAAFMLEVKDSGYLSKSKYQEMLTIVFDDPELLAKCEEFYKIPYYHTHIDAYIIQALYEREDIETFEYMYSISRKLYDVIVPDMICTEIVPPDHQSHIVYIADKESAYRNYFGLTEAVTFWLKHLQHIKKDDKAFEKYFTLVVAYTKAVDYKTSAYIYLEDLVRAFDIGLIGEDDICFYYTRPGLGEYMHSSTYPNKEWQALVRKNSEYYKVVSRIIDKVISAELQRGEAPTALSGIASKIRTCYGIGNFAGIVCAMDERNYVRGYNFPGHFAAKGEMLSFLLKNIYPSEGENAEMLRQIPEFKKLSAQKLINAAMYAPQWLSIVEEYLQMPGLLKAGMWFHAHLNEHFNDRKTAMVARYSSISPADFAAGAFEPEWFRDALAETGEKNFAMIYNAAKYIAGGSLHKRSQLFADAVRNKLNLDELKGKVIDKRNKDYLLTYTLVPIKDSDDALERFLFLEKFKKESRQYGQQRQQSEARVCDIGLGNLARNAGYDDVNRFIWQMETKKLQSVSSWFSPVKINEIELWISFDSDGKAAMNIESNGKKLSSVPSKYKKESLVLEGMDVLKSLKEQHKRARASLERAMVGRDVFKAEELDLLMSNPVLVPMLSKLLFASEDAVGLWREGSLHTVDGEPQPVSGPVFIAHPYDLLKSGRWAEWQIYFCKEQIKQPFKQVFREYYCPTADELYEKTASRRYAGHQIMPRKAIMLAASRGWNTTEGIFKVFHKERIVVELFGGLTYFTPADVESPVIETVQFFDRDSRKPLDIAAIPPVLFSEIMRDIDLIVSVAHFGEVDPEASLSTVEMRIALIHTLLQLMRLENVKLEKSHAFIKGKFGEYTVHLGSGVAHMQAKGMIPIVPVHSGQRGRVFLPFADDDPKTAEIVTKVILLAEDNKIKDVKILDFIRG
jgi:hypothetical protein